MFWRRVFVILFLVMPVQLSAQELTLDLLVKTGPTVGTLTIELFPANPESLLFRLSIRSGDGSEHYITTTSLVTTISGLFSGRRYSITAVALSSDNRMTEISPNETVVAR